MPDEFESCSNCSCERCVRVRRAEDQVAQLEREVPDIQDFMGELAHLLTKAHEAGIKLPLMQAVDLARELTDAGA